MKSIILKRVEEALQESEELTQVILDNAFDAIISMDANGQIKNWNKRAEFIFGWPASEVIGKSLSNTIIPHRYRESHTKGIKRYLATEKSAVLNQQLEMSALHRDGFEFPIEISISATQWERSFIFTGIIRDISARKKSEEQARQKTEEYEVMHEISKVLHNSGSMNTLLKGAMEAITHSKAFNFEKDAGVFLRDGNQPDLFLVSSIGKFAQFSAEFNLEALINQSIYENHRNLEAWSTNNCCLIDPSPDSKFKKIENKGLYIIPLKGRAEFVGLLILFASEATPSYERNKEILDSIGKLIADAVIRCHCEENIMKKNEEMTSANQKLKEANALKNKFLGIASHDLRNPLYLIRSYSEILKDDLFGKINVSRHAFLEKIFASSEFMQSLLDNLLDISKIESGKYDLNKKEENLNALAEDQVEFQRLMAQKKNIEIFREPGKIPTVYCDKNAMFQIMANFIGNAIKFSPANSKIHVATTQEDGAVRFSVRDEGPGICQEEKALLFNEFQTLSTKPTGGEKSTGLGLAIVKKLVTLHGGNVGVTCEPGKGSTFYFDLSPYGEEATLGR
jgi:PAS domain S-box-containing protein